MILRKDIDTFEELYNMSWADARGILEQAEEVGREDQIMQLLEEVFADTVPTETEVNDFIRFDLIPLLQKMK